MLAFVTVAVMFQAGCGSIDPNCGEQFVLTCTVETEGTGQVNISPSQPGYDAGTIVTLTPQAAAGYRFDHWQGDVIKTDNPLSLTMTSHLSVVAVFVPSSHLETKLSSQTKVLGTGTTIQSTADGKILLKAANLPSLVPGNVIVGTGTSSILAKVKGVSASDGGLLVEIEPACLTDVLQRGTINLTPYLKMSNAKIARSLAKGLFDFEIENGQLVLSVNDLEIELGDGAKVTLKNIAFGFGPE